MFNAFAKQDAEYGEVFGSSGRGTRSETTFCEMVFSVSIFFSSPEDDSPGTNVRKPIFRSRVSVYFRDEGRRTGTHCPLHCARKPLPYMQFPAASLRLHAGVARCEAVTGATVSRVCVIMILLTRADTCIGSGIGGCVVFDFVVLGSFAL